MNATLTLERTIDLESERGERGGRERTVSALLLVAVTRPNPLGGRGLSLGIEDANRVGPEVADQIIRASRLEILKRAQFVAGGMPPDGLRVSIGLGLPMGWGSMIPDVRRLASDVARATGDAIEDVLTTQRKT